MYGFGRVLLCCNICAGCGEPVVLLVGDKPFSSFERGVGERGGGGESGFTKGRD